FWRVRPDLLWQRVGRRGRLPGGASRRPRTGPSVRDWAQGSEGGGVFGSLRAGHGRRSRCVRAAAARGGDGEGGPEPSALPLGARPHAGRAQARGHLVSSAPGAEPRARRAVCAGRTGPPDEGARKRAGGGSGRGRASARDRSRMSVLVLMEDGEPSEQALTLARTWAETVHSLRMDAITPFAPDAIAAILQRAADDLKPAAVLAAGPGRGNDGMSRLAARAGLPFAANVVSAEPGDPVKVTRQRWGGSLLETATLRGSRALLTVAPYSIRITDGAAPAEVDARRYV